MIEAIQATWFLCLLVISIYHLFVFRVKLKVDSNSALTKSPGVSVLIAVRNDTEKIKQHLDIILQQHYPIFEVIVVDDRSDPEESKNLKEFLSFRPQVRLITSRGSGKKNALWNGMKNSTFDFVLCTDADCKPASNEWIRSMMEQAHPDETVIGYSSYEISPGWLNRLIRFETVMTGIQYLSWAIRGRPYMAVGRNILYPRMLFITSNPFRKHQDIPYGDDDLGVQEISENSVVKVCFEEKAHTISTPASTWNAWLKQKHRHLSAGHYYKPGLWWQPGLFGIALAGQWFFLPFVIDSIIWWNWIPVFSICLLMRWLNYYRWTSALGDKDTVSWYPFLEINYAAYLAVMGTITVFAKKRTWN